MQAHTMKNIEHHAEMFLAARTKQELAAALNEPYKRFCYLVYANDPNTQYVSYNISKIRGSVRQIDAPFTPLKFIQHKLGQILSHIYRPSCCAHAYIRERSVVTNALPHVKTNELVKIDLVDFFGSINFGRVMFLFMSHTFGFPRDVAIAIARIACKDNKLPQGGPASPIISNMICLKLDAQLNRFAKRNRCTYTRYSDDITISTRRGHLPSNIIQSYSPVELGHTLSQIVESNGFCINTNKLCLRTGTDSKVITGVKVNTKLNTVRAKVREVRAMIHAYKKFGNDNALREHIEKWTRRSRRTAPKDFKQIIDGKIAFIAMVKGRNDPVVLNLRTQLENADLLQTDTLVPSSKLHDKYCDSRSATHGLIITEGKTDRIHLAAALARLQQQGNFKSLKILFYSWPWLFGGDNILSDFCKSAKSRKFSPIPTIVIHDRDIKNSESFDNIFFGNNVWSILLPIPEHRLGWDKSISIEHYYSDETLFHTDENNRRLFIASEFDNNSLKHKTLPDITIPKRYWKKDHAILTEVKDSANANICMTKADFARRIASGMCPLAQTDTDSFLPLFRQIGKILRKHTTPTQS